MPPHSSIMTYTKLWHDSIIRTKKWQTEFYRILIMITFNKKTLKASHNRNFVKANDRWSPSQMVTKSGTIPWWRHQMETFPALLAYCEGDPPFIGGFPSQRSVTRSFGVFFYLHRNKRFSKTIETPVIWDAITLTMTSMYSYKYINASEITHMVK